MTNQEAIRTLSLHLMQCGRMMPIEWVRKNGEGSELMEAFHMAADALREQEERGKVVSNADHIRAMSDEELARFLTWNVPDCANYCDDARCGCKWSCKHGDGLHVIRDWLKQPHKEDA